MKRGSIVGASEMDGELLLRGAAVWIGDLEVDEDVLVFAFLGMVVGGVAWIEGPGAVGIDDKAIGE